MATKPQQPDPAPTLADVDPFDPANFKLSNRTAHAAATKLLVTLPVKKPPKAVFVRCCPDPAYTMEATILDDRDIADTAFLVAPNIADALGSMAKDVTLTLSITRQGDLFLWPILNAAAEKRGTENRWNTSARMARSYALKSWVRVSANMGVGAYDIHTATVAIPDPVWPDRPLAELLRIAFGEGNLINREDHPVLLEVLGRA